MRNTITPTSADFVSVVRCTVKSSPIRAHAIVTASSVRRRDETRKGRDVVDSTTRSGRAGGEPPASVATPETHLSREARETDADQPIRNPRRGSRERYSHCSPNCVSRDVSLREGENNGVPGRACTRAPTIAGYVAAAPRRLRLTTVSSRLSITDGKKAAAAERDIAVASTRFASMGLILAVT